MQPKDYQDSFFEYHLQGAIASAENVIPVLLEYVSPASVIDIGCGIGAWLKIWQSKGVKEITGVDGDYVNRKQLQIKEENFHAFNLEVAEHLPANNADAFIDSLCKLGDVIVFSAAVPGQGGTMHVNEQYPEYWANIFSKKGYVPVDCIRHRIWNDNRIQWWYRQNILFFVKESVLANYPKLNEAYKGIGNNALSFIHPELYKEKEDKVNYYESTLKTNAGIFKYLLWSLFSKKKG